MTSLRSSQETFGEALISVSRANRVAALLRGERPAALARLAVYRGNVYGNCAQALAGAYPIVRKIVGAEFFEALAREYARAEPSRSGDLNAFGARLAEFIARFVPTQDLPYLPDVARMEWQAHRAYYAADAKPLDIAHLARVEFSLLRPVLAPACALLESPWPLARIWEVHQDEYVGAIAVDFEAGPDRILVDRPRWRAQVRRLDPGDYRFLCGVRDGETLGAALEAALIADPEFDPATALARWVDAGVIVRLE